MKDTTKKTLAKVSGAFGLFSIASSIGAYVFRNALSCQTGPAGTDCHPMARDMLIIVAAVTGAAAIAAATILVIANRKVVLAETAPLLRVVNHQTPGTTRVAETTSAADVHTYNNPAYTDETVTVHGQQTQRMAPLF